jgi:hypothetical protein
MLGKFGCELCSTPDTAGKFRNALTDSKVEALDEGCIDDATQPYGFEAGNIVIRQASDETLLFDGLAQMGVTGCENPEKKDDQAKPEQGEEHYPAGVRDCHPITKFQD